MFKKVYLCLEIVQLFTSLTGYCFKILVSSNEGIPILIPNNLASSDLAITHPSLFDKTTIG